MECLNGEEALKLNRTRCGFGDPGEVPRLLKEHRPRPVLLDLVLPEVDDGKGEGDAGLPALAFALGPDPAPVGFHDASADAQAQARPGSPPRPPRRSGETSGTNAATARVTRPGPGP